MSLRRGLALWLVALALALAVVLLIMSVMNFAPRLSGSAPVGLECSEAEVAQTARVLDSSEAWRPAALLALRREIDERRTTLVSELRAQWRLDLATALDRPRVARVFCSTAWVPQAGAPVVTLPAIAARLRAAGADDNDAWFIATCRAVDARPLPLNLGPAELDALGAQCRARSRSWVKPYRGR